MGTALIRGLWERLTCSLVIIMASHGTFQKLEWPFRFVPDGSKGARPLHCHLDPSAKQLPLAGWNFWGAGVETRWAKF